MTDEQSKTEKFLLQDQWHWNHPQIKKLQLGLKPLVKFNKKIHTFAGLWHHEKHWKYSAWGKKIKCEKSTRMCKMLTRSKQNDLMGYIIA